MKLFNQILPVYKQYPRTAVALGTFDGIHLGHQQVIGHASEWAKNNNGTGIVFTFSNHPISIIKPKECPRLIYPDNVKAKLIEELGIDILMDIPFTEELLRLSPGEFINILYDNLRPKEMIVGPNYSFGYRGEGTPEMLKTAGELMGFSVKIQPAVITQGVIISSTVIRQLISTGRVNEAARLLGRQYALYDMIVTGGERRGRQLGFPTANVIIPEGLIIPEDGVYAVMVRYGGNLYPAVANIGSNPTFSIGHQRLEVHILNFTKDIYDQMIDIIFYHRIREEIRFNSPEDLKQQISYDIKQAIQLFSLEGN